MRNNVKNITVKKIIQKYYSKKNHTIAFKKMAIIFILS